MHRFLLASAAFLLLPTGARAADQAPTLANFFAARAADDIPAMSKIYDEALTARIDTAQTGPDANLDAMIGVLSTLAPNFADARPYLLRAANGGGPYAGILLLQLGAWQEMSGDPDGAAESYGKALAAATDKDTRRIATYAAARLATARTPDTAIAALTASLNDTSKPGERWEGDLLLSRAYALTGRASDAQPALARAWSEAPFAALPEQAIERTAGDMALDATERTSRISLLKVQQAKDDLPSNYPVSCGDGLAPADWVTIEIAHIGRTGIGVSAMRSSRPGIAYAFVRQIQRSHPYIKGNVVTFTVSCRRSPASSYAPSGANGNATATWMATRGLYPRVILQPSDVGDMLAESQAWIAARDAKLGTSSPAVIPTLLEVATLQLMQSQQTRDPGYAELARDSVDRALVLARAAGAPPEAIRLVQYQRDAMTPATSYATSRAAFSAQIKDMLAAPTTTVDQANELLQMGLKSPDTNLRMELADQMIAFFKARQVPPTDPGYRAAIVAKIDELRKSGMTNLIEPLTREARLPSSDCEIQPIKPNANALFTADDYPTDLLRESAEGIVAVETDVAADGTAEHPHVVWSSPPGLFDAVTLAKFRTGHLLPARSLAGQAIACTNSLSRMRWRIPDRPAVPTMNMPGS